MNYQNLFRVCDLVIESNISLPELPPVDLRIADCRFILLDPGAPIPGQFQWFNHWRSPGEGQAWLSFATCGGDYLLRFAAQVDFLVSRDTREVKCRPLPGIPESTVRHLFLDQVLPLILSYRGNLVLHASAILTPLGVVAFAGASGRGKSTLAARLAQHGYALVADNCLALREVAGRWIAHPSYPGVRLWPQASGAIFGEASRSAEIAHYTVKRRVSDSSLIRFADVSAPIQCVYFLDEEETAVRQPLIRPMAAPAAFMRLVTSTFNLDITDKTLVHRQFVAMKRARSQIKCFHLAYPRDFFLLPAVTQAIIDHQSGLDRCLSP